MTTLRRDGFDDAGDARPVDGVAASPAAPWLQVAAILEGAFHGVALAGTPGISRRNRGVSGHCTAAAAPLPAAAAPDRTSRMQAPEAAWEAARRARSPRCPPSRSPGGGAGRVLAAPLPATVDLPPADVSAMDGYALAGDAPPATRGR